MHNINSMLKLLFLKYVKIAFLLEGDLLSCSSAKQILNTQAQTKLTLQIKECTTCY